MCDENNKQQMNKKFLVTLKKTAERSTSKKFVFPLEYQVSIYFVRDTNYVKLHKFKPLKFLTISFPSDFKLMNCLVATI